MEAFTGKVWVLGDDIDTDIIIPTQHLNYETSSFRPSIWR